MAVPERQRDQGQLKNGHFWVMMHRKNLIFLEHVHNHASVVCTKLRRWVERITISWFTEKCSHLLKSSLSESEDWVRLWPHLLHLTPTPTSPLGSLLRGGLPRLFLLSVAFFCSFPGLPCSCPRLSPLPSFLPPAPILSSPLAANPCPRTESFWETQWIRLRPSGKCTLLQTRNVLYLIC